MQRIIEKRHFRRAFIKLYVYIYFTHTRRHITCDLKKCSSYSVHNSFTLNVNFSELKMKTKQRI